jgi:hypothetical protein
MALKYTNPRLQLPMSDGCSLHSSTSRVSPCHSDPKSNLSGKLFNLTPNGEAHSSSGDHLLPTQCACYLHRAFRRSPRHKAPLRQPGNLIALLVYSRRLRLGHLDQRSSQACRSVRANLAHPTRAKKACCSMPSGYQLRPAMLALDSPYRIHL